MVLVDIAYVRATDTFPTAVVKQYNLIAINAIYLIAVSIYGIPVTALLDEETAVPEDIRRLIGITVDLTPGRMVEIPIAGAALNRYISPRIVVDIVAVDAADEISVFIGEIPCVAAFDAVISIVQQVDLIAVEDGRRTAVDIDPISGSAYISAVPEILVVVRTCDGFASRYFVSGVLKP